jgi:hypothetical protein
MINVISKKEWDLLERALQNAEVPYAVSWDSHKVMDGIVHHDKIIKIEPFKIVYFTEGVQED